MSNVWKATEVIMFQKPGKLKNEVKSYRPMLQIFMFKLFENSYFND